MPGGIAVPLHPMLPAHWISRLRTGTRREREWRWFKWFAGFGLVGLPLCVFVAGRLTLGTFYLDLLKLRLPAWGLVLGPWLLFQLVRYTSRPARRLSGRLPTRAQRNRN